MAIDPDIDASAPWPQQISTKNYPYSPSSASTASSSSSSVFSIDAPSSQSSVSSLSGGWSSSRWINENENQHFSGSHSLQSSASSSNEEVVSTTYTQAQTSRVKPPTEVVAPECRQHPRRTQRLNSCESRDGKNTNMCLRAPPPLVRQSERKDNFVDSLVDTTTQMIETIWPLSVLSCSRDTVLGAKQQNLIGLRTFVQEVLRRSKTSYSTLQVALYYLILIQSCIPKHDFTMEQPEDSPSCRAMQCGRRMFLAALILASKYLQDRNFSARAWSKISGLRTCEINQNELAFLSAVNWKLHIPESVFHRWTDIVLKYSPSAQINGLPRSCPASSQTWKSIIPILTPELDNFDFGSSELSDDSGYNSPGSDMSPPPLPLREELSPCSTSNEPTPTNPYTIPRTLEPTPRETNADEQILPPLPRLGPLPTPQLTPQTGAFCTPAVGASGLCTGRSSMSYAMAQIQNSCLARSTLDNPHQWRPNAPAPFPTSARRSSLAKSTSSMSSPESMISDVSTRSSRSSSISSIASSNCALPPPRLAVQATRRCANMQLCGLREENERPVVADDDMSWEVFSASPDCYYNNNYNNTGPKAFDDRCQSITPTNHSASTREAAAALRDLALNRKHDRPQDQTRSRPQKCRKRSRPNSIDLSIQSCVRDLVAPHYLGELTNMGARNEEDGTIIIPDDKIADSFLLPRCENNNPNPNPKPTLNTADVNFLNGKPKQKHAISREGLPRKRTCAGSDRGGREEARMMERLIRERELDSSRGIGPGMWEGII